jgi:hypothetical protein
LKYLYTPYDIAVFFVVSDFTQSNERAVIRDIWENDKASIPTKYRKDEILFRRRIYFELSKFDGSLDDLDELNILMRDTDHALCIDGTINEQCVIESYFKIIKLELTHIPNKDYCKIKLRRLLKAFGYKRRSAQLVGSIRRTLGALKLKTHLRGYVPCDIAEIGIDDMVMIRLK